MIDDKKTPEELTNLNSSQLLHKVDELKDRVIKLGYEHAEADKKYHDLKALMPSFLAEYQAHYSGPGVNATTAKYRALGDKGYQEKIKQMTLAEYEARLLYVEHQANLESLRSITAISFLRNNEIKLAR